MRPMTVLLVAIAPVLMSMQSLAEIQPPAEIAEGHKKQLLPYCFSSMK